MGSPTAPKMGRPSVNETKFLTVAIVEALDIATSNTKIAVKIISIINPHFTDVTITVQDDFLLFGSQARTEDRISTISPLQIFGQSPQATDALIQSFRE
jgi:hypothetical protein